MRIFSRAGAAMAMAICAVGTANSEVTAQYNIVPQPVEITLQTGKPFLLTDATVICYPKGNEALRKNAELLADYLKTLTGKTLRVTDMQPKQNAIILTDDLEGTNPEAYTLRVDNKNIRINGASAAGNYYGINTLRKSITASCRDNVSFPAVEISDAPRFGYRGAHFDVSRHFFPADSVKAYIDIIALHNINRLHWHLTDDQGWRLEIKKRPNLTEKGSMRKGTMIGSRFDTFDSIPHGGYYTQDEVRDVIKYAADRHITVIPEIDLPGHMLGALAGYPELGCTGGPYEVWHKWGVSDDVLCAGNADTYALIEDVLTEVAELFPSEYIHIGGDECPKVRWKECPKCQAKITELGLVADETSSAEDKLQSYVMSRAIDVLSRHGKQAIGWDEILEGGIPEGSVIMSWRGIEGAEQAARAGHDAIMTPIDYCYFNFLQMPYDITDEIQLSYITYLPIEKAYMFDPVPASLTEEQAKHILGAQANLWTEYIPTFDNAQYKLLPRLAAMAEVGWTAPEKKNFADFMRRLLQFRKQYDANGYNYCKFVF